MRIEILSEVEDDLAAGAQFYERKPAGLGEYLFALGLFGYRLVASLRRSPPGGFRFSPSSVEAIPFCDFFIVLTGNRIATECREGGRVRTQSVADQKDAVPAGQECILFL